MSQNILRLLIFFPTKFCKTILNSWAVQKAVLGQTGSTGHSLLTSGVRNRTKIYTIEIIFFNDVEILIFFLNNYVLLITQSTRCHENLYFSDAQYVILKLPKMLCQIN